MVKELDCRLRVSKFEHYCVNFWIITIEIAPQWAGAVEYTDCISAER